MKSINNRIEKLELIAPPKQYMNLREMMDAERTPGTPEHEALRQLYNANRSKPLQEYLEGVTDKI